MAPSVRTVDERLGPNLCRPVSSRPLSSLTKQEGALSSVKKREGKQPHWLSCKAVRILLKLLPKLLGK